VKPETIQHLETAARNRELARALVSLGPTMGLPSPPFEWVAVVAFYAAVHYVNAILWEWGGVKPDTHTERTWYVEYHPPLAAFRLEYRHLNIHGWNARYAAGYRLSLRQAQTLVEVTLLHVERVVCSSLGVSPF
jgi:hypothetical protein